MVLLTLFDLVPVAGIEWYDPSTGGFTADPTPHYASDSVHGLLGASLTSLAVGANDSNGAKPVHPPMVPSPASGTGWSRNMRWCRSFVVAWAFALLALPALASWMGWFA